MNQSQLEKTSQSYLLKGLPKQLQPPVSNMQHQTSFTTEINIKNEMPTNTNASQYEQQEDDQIEGSQITLKMGDEVGKT